MNARLNVTNVERLCYSRRKLQTLSALRNAGINPKVYGLNKEYHVLGVKRNVYLVEHPDGTRYHFTSLAAIHAYLSDYQAWQGQTIQPDWHVWRARMQKPRAPLAGCAWPDCPYLATAWLEEQALCPKHASLYEITLEARRKRRVALQVPAPASAAVV